MRSIYQHFFGIEKCVRYSTRIFSKSVRAPAHTYTRNKLFSTETGTKNTG